MTIPGTVPSPRVVRVFNERGGRVAKVVTPTVLREVREFFACTTLNGAELENQQPGGECFGSHW